MRRAIPVITATAGGLALIAGFHTNPTGLRLATSPDPTRTTTPTSTATPTSTTPATSSRASASTSTVAPAVPRSVVGPVVTTLYGLVQVRASLLGRQIVDVQALQLPSDRARSVSISQYAGPRLRYEALQAQSANISLVSGASYTSEGYIRSLQGALNQAGR
jgi:uncharacterized protein with FMN-binding domain